MGIFGAHELPGGVAKAVMVVLEVHVSYPGLLGSYLIKRPRENLSLLVELLKALPTMPITSHQSAGWTWPDLATTRHYCYVQGTNKWRLDRQPAIPLR